jgi:hypothetical protein
MPTKQDVIQQILTLMKEYEISLHELSESQNQNPDVQGSNTIIKKLFAFIGGIFILSGLGIYISQHWSEMNSAARIIITFGTGIALFVFAIIGSREQKYAKILTPLFLLAALFELIGMFVTINELFPRGHDLRYAALVVFGTLFLQQIFTFWKTPRTSLIFISLLFGYAFYSIAFNLMWVASDTVSTLLGASLICISYGLDQTSHRAIAPFWYLFGSIIFLYGVFSLCQNTRVELLYIGISTLIIYLSTIVRSRTLLFSGTVSLIGYIGYFTSKHFVNSIGWPISLILFGLIMLGISAAAFNIGKKL